MANEDRIERFRKSVLNSTDSIQTCMGFLTMDGGATRYTVRLPHESEGLIEAVVHECLGGRRESTAHVLRFLIAVGLLAVTGDDDTLQGLRDDFIADARRQQAKADEKRMGQIETETPVSMHPEALLAECQRLRDRATTIPLQQRASTQILILKGRI